MPANNNSDSAWKLREKMPKIMLVYTNGAPFTWMRRTLQKAPGKFWDALLQIGVFFSSHTIGKDCKTAPNTNLHCLQHAGTTCDDILNDKALVSPREVSLNKFFGPIAFGFLASYQHGHVVVCTNNLKKQQMFSAYSRAAHRSTLPFFFFFFFF